MTNHVAKIIVIGSGAAGLASALTAIEQGIKDVVVIEKRNFTGGNSGLAGGTIFAVESHLQKEAGINTTCDDIFRETMEYHHYDRVNPRIIRALIDKSGATVQWLEKYGIGYELRNGNHMMKNVTKPFGNFNRATKLLSQKINAEGGRIFTGSRVKKIMRDAEGNVSGVVAMAKDNTEFQVHSHCVILATGGFTGNQALLNKYFPEYYDNNYYTDSILLVGDGIQLAEDAGAALESYCTLIRENGYCFGKKGSGKLPNRIHMEPSSVWVNKNGLRYHNEAIYIGNSAANALVTQPGKTGFALFDENLIKTLEDKRNPFAQSQDNRSLREILADENKEGWTCIGGSWDEIADWIGCDRTVLNKTLVEYNTFCTKGHDNIFAKGAEYLRPLKKAPFYCVKFRPLMVDTVGPVKINERMEVVDTRGDLIRGFYAAGVITAGWQGNDYHLFGSALGFSLNSGRIAGENAAKYILGKK